MTRFDLGLLAIFVVWSGVLLFGAPWLGIRGYFAAVRERDAARKDQP